MPRKRPSHKDQLKTVYAYFRHNLPGHRKRKIIVLSIALPLVILTIAILILFKDVPNPNKLTKTPSPVGTQILDRNGKLLYEIFIDQNRQPVKITDLPPYVLQSTISIEDKNFYRHHGLDTNGIIRATSKIITGQRLEGGSTITQQLAKFALLSDNRRTISRKIKEAVLALITEITYSKSQILELYLNHVPYGGTAYGIETAAKTYFNKNAKDLTLPEAALLAGLPQSPTRYSPFGAHPELAINRQHQVLQSMVNNGYITADQKTEAENTPVIFTKNTSIKAPHFSLMVKDLLTEKYGEDKVNLGGLRVTTSLDLNLQEYAQASVSAEIKKLAKLKVGNGAALITKPNTGEILAMIGSTDYFDLENDGNVNLTVRLRQPGSSIKPVNYAVGLLNGYPTSTMYLDLPTCFNVTNQKSYCPQNYDGSFHGPVQMRYALGNSYNIPAVKQLAMNTTASLIATASAMGISSWTDQSRFGLSLTLGGGEVTMWDMATAFGTFANSGVTVPLNPINKIETYTGQVLEERNIEAVAGQVATLPQDWQTFWENNLNPDNPTGKPGSDIHVSLPSEVAYIISDILSDNSARSAAFGSVSQLVIPKHTVSVKTGTTNDLRDNWTIGYTPDYLIATWVGNNDNSQMSRVTSGVTGASPIWNTLMKKVLANTPDHPLPKPENVVSYQVCNLTGLLATFADQCNSRNELFIKGLLPVGQQEIRKQVWVRRSDKYPVLEGDNTIDRDLEEHTVVSDAFLRDFCLDCNYPKNDKDQTVWPETIINLNNFVIEKPKTMSGG